MSDHRVRILTLNCWGLKYVSKDRIERIGAIASFLSRSSHDIVCLQELWVQADFETVRVSVSSHLPFFKIFHSGAVGAGLVIFSRFPIIAATIQSYSLNGSPLDLQGADWASGKAAASVLVKHPVLGQLQVFNTHFFSEGGDDGPEYLRAHRLVNAWEFAKLVKQSAEIGRYVIAAGDFNSSPHTLPMTVVREHAGLHDVWSTLRPPLPSYQTGETPVNPVDALSLYGFTYDSPVNSYTPLRSGNKLDPAPQGNRIDYIFFRNPASSPAHPSQIERPHLVPTEVSLALTGHVPGHTFSYSDHFGIEAIFKIELPDAKSDTSLDSPSDVKGAPTVSSTAAPASVNNPNLSHEHTMMVIHALQTFLKHSKNRARGQMRMFTGCALLLLAILVGTGWSPKGYLTPVFVLLGSAVTWVGTTMFYVGLFYGKWEAKALQSAVEELELYAQNIDAGH